MEKPGIIGIGAEARLYLINLFGADIIIKERLPKKYRAKALDLKIRKERTKNEARIMFRVSKAGIRCPRIVALGRYSIYMERLEGVLLKDKEISSKEISEAGQILGRMHSLDIIHGDFTPANLISDNSGNVYVIDFGLSAMARSEEEKAVDLLLMKRYLKKNLYSLFEDAYSKTYSDSEKILRRLEEVEKRGRYQIRTLA